MVIRLGVFIPIGNTGWLISTTSPQDKPSYDLNKAIVDKAERFGFDFALSMIKLYGFGGSFGFWADRPILSNRGARRPLPVGRGRESAA